MATWNYTKNVIMDNKSQEGRMAHENASSDSGGLQDWYYDQIESGLADPTMAFVPIKLVPDNVWEHLVTDQAQADSLIITALATAERIGYPLSATVVDVDYTTDTIPDDFDVN